MKNKEVNEMLRKKSKPHIKKILGLWVCTSKIGFSYGRGFTPYSAYKSWQAMEDAESRPKHSSFFDQFVTYPYR